MNQHRRWPDLATGHRRLPVGVKMSEEDSIRHMVLVS